jgi:hypothetical protein
MTETIDLLQVPGVVIRKFADAGIQASIDKALEHLKPGTHGAVIAYSNGDGANLAVVGRRGEHWSVVGVLDKPWKGKLNGEAAVRFEW